ncbi:MAG: RluA family pseudouridine synthase [Lachnospiraceae bacterium]|nr:RluA family pseudouridine synthase [Lachnospiraceae bacterium]
MIFNNFVVTEDDAGIRIDKYLAEANPEMSRSRISKLIDDGFISVNGATIMKSNYKVNEDDVILLEIPDAVEPSIDAEDIPLDILYEDDDVIVINKPKGLVVHPAPGHYTGTLVNALMYHCKGNLSGINGIMRPGIVHRIDKDTTGVIVACKNDVAHNSLASQLKVHSITRKYEAIVYNVIKEDEGTVNAPIGRSNIDRKKMAINYSNGRDAITHFKVIERFKNYSYIECKLETGRTHQIRVHMSSRNNPLLGDEVYGPKKCPYNLEGQVLHARILGFRHPRTGEYMEFEAPLPEYFTNLLQLLKNK